MWFEEETKGCWVDCDWEIEVTPAGVGCCVSG